MGPSLKLLRRKPFSLKQTRDISDTSTTIYESDCESLSTTTIKENRISSPLSQRLPRRSSLKVRSQTESLKLLFCSRSLKSLQWSHLDIHLHAPILGDNPSVTSGPPMTLSWHAHGHSKLNIDDFECTRQGKRKDEDELVLSRWEREGKLIDAGHTRHELDRASIEVTVCKHEHEKNMKMLAARYRFKSALGSLSPFKSRKRTPKETSVAAC